MVNWVVCCEVTQFTMAVTNHILDEIRSDEIRWDDWRECCISEQSSEECSVRSQSMCDFGHDPFPAIKCSDIENRNTVGQRLTLYLTLSGLTGGSIIPWGLGLSPWRSPPLFVLIYQFTVYYLHTKHNMLSGPVILMMAVAVLVPIQLQNLEIITK